MVLTQKGQGIAIETELMSWTLQLLEISKTLSFCVCAGEGLGWCHADWYFADPCVQREDR